MVASDRQGHKMNYVKIIDSVGKVGTIVSFISCLIVTGMALYVCVVAPSDVKWWVRVIFCFMLLVPYFGGYLVFEFFFNRKQKDKEDEIHPESEVTELIKHDVLE